MVRSRGIDESVPPYRFRTENSVLEDNGMQKLHRIVMMV
jgi:hypothetical protein